ncbi:alpha/beta hydrolase family protein [Chryseobacterium echinoideorum]|uniref:alpha/beta hydrolase family protein n=1 Tax=Chryseobacterium echinoideorum TaxID=1549648 RepID=UPI001E5AA0A3|nr:prolyl oligopeptidase family serine peptidase [Chryseobacterium echinoideorum]
MEKLVGQAEELDFLKMSEDGKWVSWLTMYEDKPTVYNLKSTDGKGEVIHRMSVSKSFFIGNERFAFLAKGKLEIVNLKNRSSELIDDVEEIELVGDSEMFVVHFNKSKNRRLEVYDFNLKKLQTFNHVNRLLIMENTLVLSEVKDGLNDIWKVDGKGKELIAKTEGELLKVWKGSESLKGYFIFERVGGKYVFKHHTNPLEKAVNFDFLQSSNYHYVSMDVSSDKKAVFLTLIRNVIRKDEPYEIWYGAEKDLRHHIKDIQVEDKVLWFPESNKVQKLDSVFESQIAVGSKGDFLAVKKDLSLVDHLDNTYKRNPDSLFIYSSGNAQYSFLKMIDDKLYVSPDRKWVLTADDNYWSLYDSETKRSNSTGILISAIPYFRGRDKVLWINGNEVWESNLITGKQTERIIMKGSEISVVNAKSVKLQSSIPRAINSVPSDQEIILCIDEGDLNKSYFKYDNGKVKKMIAETRDRISNLSYNKSLGSYSWFQQNFNMPQKIVYQQIGKKEKTILSSNINDEGVKKIQKKLIYYKGSLGETLTATLFLPPSYNEEKKYPVVLNIYQRQQKGTTEFLKPTFKNQKGFNVRMLLESGYMVVLPDISYGEKGPGVSALLCINNMMDELIKIKQVDSHKVALTGQSFGGYETNFVSTQTSRFATFISGASISDVIHVPHSFNYSYGGADFRRYEYGQFDFRGKFKDLKQKYIDNNPLYFAENVSRPMMLWTGEKDLNVDPEETRSFFNALRQERKSVLAFFYKNEGHSLRSKVLQKDFTYKFIQWLDYFLMSKKDIDWIDKQMTK